MKLNKNDIVTFWKPQYDNGYLCQWYPTSFTDGAKTFNCTEQYMMFQKAILFRDFNTANKILRENDPRKIKKLGREVQRYNDNIWKEKRYNIVREGNLHKFRCNKLLQDKLLSTGDKILIEASPKDKIWGVGLKASDKAILDTNKWKGDNLLGKALMEVREELRK